MVSDRRGLILAVAGLTIALVVLFASTGPRPTEEASGSIRRSGGVCLELEHWSLLGWAPVGQTHSVEDMQNSVWRPPQDAPPCVDVPQREYLVRIFDQPSGIYRLCGLADDRACVEFRKVPFENSRA